MQVDIYKNGRLIGRHQVKQAGPIVQLDHHEIEWAIENYGRCDQGEYTVVMATTGYPGPLPEGKAELPERTDEVIDGITLTISVELQRQGVEFDNLGDGHSIVLNGTLPTINLTEIAKAIAKAYGNR